MANQFYLDQNPLSSVEKVAKGKILPVKIVATGRYLPEKVVTNEDFIKEFKLNISPEELERRLGTKEHRVADINEQPSDLIVKAAKKILEKANLTPKDITKLIVSTTPDDFIEPSTAPVVQGKLGIRCPVIEISLSCTGWLTGVDVAARYIINSDKKERILVIGGALLSRTLPVYMVQHRAIFGDGAAGVLLEKTKEGEKGYIYGSEFVSLGEYYDLIHWPAPWSVPPKRVPKEGQGYFYMGGTEVLFRLLCHHVGITLNKLWEKTGFCPDDVAFALLHQPSGPLFDETVKVSTIPREKIAQNFDRYGNTVSAELPISLDEAIEGDKIKRGDLLLLVTYGAGITGGCMLLRY